ncbi:hypothetical protein [Umezawaea sp. NPDC059074]|uniref:hypothetical protein n=1 Tax=Umezawaea sp. NPDC059074 TaxID=3346716 RepID=UPI00367DF9C2
MIRLGAVRELPDALPHSPNGLALTVNPLPADQTAPSGGLRLRGPKTRAGIGLPPGVEARQHCEAVDVPAAGPIAGPRGEGWAKW